MVLYRILCNKHEVSYFMKLLIFLSMIITSSKAVKVYSSQKSPLQTNYNETLSDQDFEDSLGPNVLSENNYSLPNLLEKGQLVENEIKFQSSTQHDISGLKKTKKFLLPKKHRNIIKMVCESDNLISQMTLHMNFLDNSKDEKHHDHDFTFKKIFNSDDPKNEVSFFYPEVSETLSDNKSDETGEKEEKDIQLSVSKPYNENESLKMDNNIHYLLLNEKYETYPVSKKKTTKTQTYSKDDYNSEIKKFSSGPRIESLKSKENYSSNHVNEKNRNKKLKFWVTAMAFTDTLKKSDDLKKNNLLHKLHFSQSSDHLDPLPSNSNTPEAEYLNSDPGIDNGYSFIPQDFDNIEQAQNNTQNYQDNNFSDKDDGENKSNEEVLNYSKTLKKYKLKNSKDTIGENENINQLYDTVLYDYPVSYKKQYRNKVLNKHNDQLKKQQKIKTKYKEWKSSLITQPKMKSIISSNRAQIIANKNSVAIADKKEKTLQRQKVIENLKFILSKQGSEHPKTDGNILKSKDFLTERKTKDAPKMLNFSKKLDKKNNTKVFDVSHNLTNNIIFQKDDKETETSSAMEESLLEHQNQNLPFDIYDIDMNDNDAKTKLRNEVLFHLANNEKYVNGKDLHSKFDPSYKKDKRLTNKKNVYKEISQESSLLEKHLVKRTAEDKGEEIRKGVFLKKGIPLQFNPYQKINDLDNKQLLVLETMSPLGDSLSNFKNGNEKQKSQAENIFKSKEQKNSQSNFEGLKIDIKRDAMSDNTYQKACSRFLRDIALIKFLDDKYSSDSIFFSN